jgi:hypothetical protein
MINEDMFVLPLTWYDQYRHVLLLKNKLAFIHVVLDLHQDLEMMAYVSTQSKQEKNSD